MTTAAQHPPTKTSAALGGPPPWVDEFVRVRDWRAEGREAELRTLIARGELVPVSRGVARWASSARVAVARGEHPRDDAYRARIRGSMLVASPRAVVSHLSAALLWGLSSLEPWPHRVAHTVAPGLSSRSSRWVERHVHSVGTTVRMDGMKTTAVARTIADVARTARRDQAFCLAATGLFTPRRGQALVSLNEVRTELDAAGAARGVRAARALIEQVGFGCESAAEAMSLLLMLDAGFVRPQQQTVFSDSEGPMVVDCWWPEVGLIGECDGLTKYLRTDRGDGLAASAAVVAEKRREDRLRALGFRVIRWTTNTLKDARAFVALLTTAGVPRVRR